MASITHAAFAVAALLLMAGAVAAQPTGSAPAAGPQAAPAPPAGTPAVVLEHSQIITRATGEGAVAETNIGPDRITVRGQGEAEVIIRGPIRVEEGEPPAQRSGEERRAAPSGR